MAQQEGGQERTEEATPKRQRESSEKGQIARSRELTTLVMLIVGAAGMLFMGEGMVKGLLDSMRQNFRLDDADIRDATLMPGAFLSAALDALVSIAPLLAVLVIAALLAPLALGGWSFSAQAMEFKWERLDPIKGLGKLFAWRSVMELLKALAKFILVAVTAVILLNLKANEFLTLGTAPVNQAIAHTVELLLWGFLFLSASLVVVAAVDVPFQLWDHAKQMRMTRQEVKDENKETEGNPEMKARVRTVQREMARRRMMAEVPKADVVVTNPTHFAVALRYDQSKMRAPVVLAKGADLIAAQIRSVAAQHHIPLVSAPPLARAVYHHTEIDHEIPAGLYMAVAQVLAYVYQIKRQGRPLPERDTRLNDLPIPDDLRHD